MKKLFIITVIIMALMSISAVCAMENATDDCSNELNIEKENSEFKTAADSEIILQNSTATRDSDIRMTIDNKELIKNQNLVIHYSNSDYADITGNLTCYIDDELTREINIENKYSDAFHFNVDKYETGNHTCKIYYSGDDCYKPFNQTFEFEISPAVLVFREIMYDYEYINVLLPEDATGTVTININGTKKRYNADNIDSYDKRKCIYHNINDLKYGAYNLEMTYSGNYGNLTKNATFTKDYDFWLNDHGNLTEYVNENNVLFFGGFANKVTVLIDGVNINYNPNDNMPATRYTNPPNYYDGFWFDYAPIWLDRISMSKGYHTLEIKNGGDKTHPAKTIKEVFYLNKPRLAKFTEPLVNKNYPINFIFPRNTTGNITVYTSSDGKNYKLYAQADIVKNSAKISVPCTKTGKKYVKVIYNTNNGNGNAVTSFKVIPAKVEYYQWIELDPYYKETFTLKSGKKVTGTFSIYVNKKLYKSVKITKQTTKITLPNIFDKPGKNTITAVWKTNHGNGKKSIKVTIPHFVTLKTVKVKKSAKKLTLQASLSKNNNPLKNKKVTFKFNGKTYKAKTNKKGIAKVTIKKSVLSKLKVGKKITYQATYLKDTVKKTVKVKR